MIKVGIEDIIKAREVIKDVVKKTDLLESLKFGAMTGARVFLKCENLQKTGSFKLRGAYNKIVNLTDEEKASGVIASSAGNHAQGVALSASQLGIKATIVMPVTAPLSKISATKSMGAEVILEGEVFDDAYVKAVEVQKETGATFIHAFDDDEVIAGQGTIALEILEQLNNKVDTIICPIGGGGIIAGIAIAAKALNPNIKIVGVEADNVPSMRDSLVNDRVTTSFKAATIADGIAVKTPGNRPFEIIEKYVDEVITVTEEEIANAIMFTLESQKILAEGAGAVASAAILSKKYVPNKDEVVVCVISGGNIDINSLYRIINVSLLREGRRFPFRVYMEDKPGNIAKITTLISNEGGNILTIGQDKITSGVSYGIQVAEFVVETFDRTHIRRIRESLEKEGFKVECQVEC